MKSKNIHILLRCISLLLTAECLLLPFCGEAEEEKRSKHSTNAVDSADCERRLNLIYGAFQAYQKSHRALPRRLSDLIPEYLSDPDALICPFVKKRSPLEEWRTGFDTVPVFNDPNRCSYAYEFCLDPIPAIPWWTSRHYKQRQMELMGFGVPIIRCFAHRPILNLGFDGSIYPSDIEWEDNYVLTPKHQSAFHDVLIFTNITQNEVALKAIEARQCATDARQVDLSKYYNATLMHLSQLDRSGKLLTTYPTSDKPIGGIPFDIRGLVHLSAWAFPIHFPQSVQNIEINQKCAAIHFLHGTMFKAPHETPISKYVVHYENGELSDIPIVYGKHVKTRWFDADQKNELENPPVAWSSPLDRVGSNGKALRLYQHAWTNPKPGTMIRSIDFISNMTDSAPFLVAITTE